MVGCSADLIALYSLYVFNSSMNIVLDTILFFIVVVLFIFIYKIALSRIYYSYTNENLKQKLAF